MAKYTSGALTAFLSGEPIVEEAEPESKIKKKLKKKKAERNEQPLPEQLDEENKKGTGDEALESGGAAEAASTSRKKRQSYGKSMSDDEKQKTIYVGNLPVAVTEKVLKRMFSSCGAIDAVRFRLGIPGKQHLPKKAAVIKRNFSEGQNTIIAYVKFREAVSVQEALKMNGNVYDGRHIQVDSCASAKRYDDKKTVFLGNLPFDATEEKLYEHFSDCGDIDKVRLVRDRVTGAGKGFGFVVFKDPTSVSFALKLDGEKFDNRNLRITRVVKKQKRQAVVSTVGSTKKREKFESKSKKRSIASTEQNPKRPSKRIRELVKKRKSKKDRKSYTSTF